VAHIIDSIFKTLVFVCLFLELATPAFSGPNFWEVSAHRGDRLIYRENSISALIHAMDIGATSVEFDVHLTKDGVPVIYHDYKLNPEDFIGLTKPLLIKEVTLAELKRFPYSTRLVTRPGDTNLITFEEFLLSVRNLEQQGKHTIPLHLEIKSEKEFLQDSAPIDQLAKAISDVINKIKIKTPIIARAFNWDVLTEFRKHQPAIPRVLLVDRGDWAKIDFPTAIKEFQPIAFAPNYQDLTVESITYLRTQNIDVNPWTVNDPTLADKLIKMGVAGITTDHPSVFLRRYESVLRHNACLNFYR
jgi:glycerophosphoryl diester phosphodiesterase